MQKTAIKYQLNHFLVDTESNQISVQNKCTHIEPKMMKVLTFLCRNHAEVVTVEQLLIEFWSGTFYGDAPVHKCIAMLRKALGDNAKAPTFIETIPQKGYRLIAEVKWLTTEPIWQQSTNRKIKKWRQGSPFIGLNAFTEQHADIYFGREHAIADMLSTIKQGIVENKSVLLLGKSGSGKTSLLRAGVLPYLTRDGGFNDNQIAGYQFIRPKTGNIENYLVQILEALEQLTLLSPDLHNAQRACQLLAQPDLINQWLLNIELPQLLILDQFEQLLNVDASEQLSALGKLLTYLQSYPKLLLIVSMRNDFYAALSDHSDFRGIKYKSIQYDVAPLTMSELAQVINYSAEAAGLSYEVDEQRQLDLVQQLLQDAIHQREPLPLLQFALTQLYQHKRADGVMLLDAYEKMGGLEGAIAKQAEQTFSSLNSMQQQCFAAVMTKLVRHSLFDDKLLISKPATETSFETEAQQQFIQAFVEARLFVRLANETVNDSEYSQSPTMVAISHEALLRQWQRVVDWSKSQSQLLDHMAQLEADCNLWQQSNNNKDLLMHSAKKINDAHLLLKQPNIRLSKAQSEFIELSTIKQQRRTNIKQGAVAGLISLTLVSTSLTAYSYYQQKSLQTLQSKGDQLISYMLGDLKSQLEPIGKLDLLQGVGHRAMDYYQGQQGQGRFLQVQSLMLLAEIAISKSEYEQANRWLNQSSSLLEQETEQSFRATFWQAQLAYWQGTVHYYSGDKTQTQDYWLQYAQYAKLLESFEGEQTTALKEQSYAFHNLGALAVGQAKPNQAVEYLEQSLALKRQLLQNHPNDQELTLSVINSSIALARLAIRYQHLDKAYALAKDTVQQAVTYANQRITDNTAQKLQLMAINQWLNIMVMVNQFQDASLPLKLGTEVTEQLLQKEGSNASWNATFLRNLLATLDVMGANPHADLQSLANQPLLKREQINKIVKEAKPGKVNWYIGRMLILVLSRLQGLPAEVVPLDINALTFNKEFTPRLLVEEVLANNMTRQQALQYLNNQNLEDAHSIRNLEHQAFVALLAANQQQFSAVETKLMFRGYQSNLLKTYQALLN
ncbi:winged helix-turn-helix domain-containing protein [Paraferrimonas sp. SM1919]|uniref:nSTAND1 domain-containing NTPase n=1 Tax=Paraferrimonas sp. SM1919 TaxID=2662263 RepID=UPI0013D1C050|nr:winged helix-turn-helix domain-containing protein [Paraferrimonas sp. SM1919]